MQIFELHFNPKLKADQVFDSFIYEPENVYEKKLGSLYMAGQLQNVFPQNLKFLDRLAGIIKKNYYTLSVKTPEKALSFCLKKTNEYLDQEIKKDNVSWLGNLNFAVLAVIGPHLIFTKTGKLKVFLLRGGNIIDIGKELELREMEPYPVRIFLNTASGKLSEGDIILVLTKDIFDFFKQQNLLDKIAKAEKIDSKKIKEIIPSSLFAKGDGLRVSGICFLAQIQEKDKKTKQILPIFFQEKRKLKILPKIHLPRIHLPKIPKIPTFFKKMGSKIQLADEFRKKIILVIVLISLLVFGFLAFKKTVEIKKEAPEETIKDNIENLKEVSELEYNQVSNRKPKV